MAHFSERRSEKLAFSGTDFVYKIPVEFQIWRPSKVLRLWISLFRTRGIVILCCSTKESSILSRKTPIKRLLIDGSTLKSSNQPQKEISNMSPMVAKQRRTNNPMACFKAVILCVVLSSFRIQEVFSFQQRTPRCVFSAPTKANNSNRPFETNPFIYGSAFNRHDGWVANGNGRRGGLVSRMAPPENENNNTPVDNFDGEGFANYLLPYALALIGSLAATAVIFKFVLLDY